jgi:hypothetical protein
VFGELGRPRGGFGGLALQNQKLTFLSVLRALRLGLVCLGMVLGLGGLSLMALSVGQGLLWTGLSLLWVGLCLLWVGWVCGSVCLGVASGEGWFRLVVLWVGPGLLWIGLGLLWVGLCLLWGDWVCGSLCLGWLRFRVGLG